MAIMAYLLREYSSRPVDITRVMLMCLIHDVVEINAGDTYAYDEEGKKTQKAREEAARTDLFLLPEDQKEELQLFLTNLRKIRHRNQNLPMQWTNLQPLMLNNSNDGGTGENMVSAQSRFTAVRAAQKKVLKNCMRLQIRS